MQQQQETRSQIRDELSERRNIYDNDEFDVFSRDKVDMSKINIGKKFEKCYYLREK